MKHYRRKTGLIVYFFKVNSVDIIDLTYCGNDARFINHSCDSKLQSVQVGSQLRLITKRYIEAGEEVTLDYTLQASGNDNFECQCEAVKCRNRF
uniref:SET domain-containing protein n=1 Tax=Panagrellus redivivus TaxID=6233 RepID=A0A7E4VB05_PANRE